MKTSTSLFWITFLIVVQYNVIPLSGTFNVVRTACLGTFVYYIFTVKSNLWQRKRPKWLPMFMLFGSLLPIALMNMLIKLVSYKSYGLNQELVEKLAMMLPSIITETLIHAILFLPCILLLTLALHLLYAKRPVDTDILDEGML